MRAGATTVLRYSPGTFHLREVFEDLNVELEELLWDMERLGELDQDLGEEDESLVTANESVSAEPRKA